MKTPIIEMGLGLGGLNVYRVETDGNVTHLETFSYNDYTGARRAVKRYEKQLEKELSKKAKVKK